MDLGKNERLECHKDQLDLNLYGYKKWTHSRITNLSFKSKKSNRISNLSSSIKDILIQIETKNTNNKQKTNQKTTIKVQLKYDN